MVMSARNQERRPHKAPQARTARLRFPNWTRFRLRRRFVHGFRMLSCSLSCFGIEARPWEMHLHLARLGIIAADDDLLGVGCHQNAGHWVFPMSSGVTLTRWPVIWAKSSRTGLPGRHLREQMAN